MLHIYYIYMMHMISCFSCAWNSSCATSWTVADQVPQSLGFSRQNIGVGYHSLLIIHMKEKKGESESHSAMSDYLWPHGPYSPLNSPGQNTGVGSYSLLLGVFLTQGLNPGIPGCRQILYQLNYKGSPRILTWITYPTSVDLTNSGIESGSSALQADSLPTELSRKNLIQI